MLFCLLLAVPKCIVNIIFYMQVYVCGHCGSSHRFPTPGNWTRVYGRNSRSACRSKAKGVATSDVRAKSANVLKKTYCTFPIPPPTYSFWASCCMPSFRYARPCLNQKKCLKPALASIHALVLIKRSA